MQEHFSSQQKIKIFTNLLLCALEAQLNPRERAGKDWCVKGLNPSPVNDLTFINFPHAANVGRACQWEKTFQGGGSTSFRKMAHDCKMPTVNAVWAWGRKCRNLLPRLISSDVEEEVENLRHSLAAVQTKWLHKHVRWFWNLLNSSNNSRRKQVCK